MIKETINKIIIKTKIIPNLLRIEDISLNFNPYISIFRYWDPYANIAPVIKTEEASIIAIKISLSILNIFIQSLIFSIASKRSIILKNLKKDHKPRKTTHAKKNKIK